MRDLDNGALCIAVDQHIGFGVNQHRSPDFLRPVIEMCDASQACFDSADNDGRVAVRLARALAVNDHRAVGTPGGFRVGRIGIVAPQPPVGGVAVDHGIHVSGGDAEQKSGPPQHPECIDAVPVRLGNDAHAESLRFEQPADDGHAEARMIDVRIASDEDDVAFIPAERIHLRTRHRQERCDAESRRPVLAIAEDVPGGLHNAHYRRYAPQL